MVINRPSSYRQLLNICFWWWWYSQHAVTRYTVIENKNGIQSFHVQNKTLNLKWSLKNRNCNCFFNKHNSSSAENTKHREIDNTGIFTSTRTGMELTTFGTTWKKSAWSLYWSIKQIQPDFEWCLICFILIVRSFFIFILTTD